ncbi:hypothetical protein [Pseudonocardia yuanmonensis]
MPERPDERIAGGGLEGTVSEQEGVPALAEDEIRSERGDEHSAAPGQEEPSGPLPEEPDPAGSD